MNFEYFGINGDKIWGKGTDEVGEFDVEGNILNTGRFRFIK